MAAIRALAPTSEAQRELRPRAMMPAEDVNANRWLLLLQQHDSISTPLLVVVVFWLTLIFMGFGLFSPPRNATVILEMDDPLTGVVRISDVPMRKALACWRMIKRRVPGSTSRTARLT